MSNSIKPANSDYHIGLCILKIFLSFEVVLMHFGVQYNGFKFTIPFYMCATASVPVFMMVSFTFAKKTLLNASNVQLCKRMSRLFIPLIVWSIIYVCADLILRYLFNHHLGYPELVRSVKDFLWQTFTGHRENVNVPMWFQVDLILLSVLCYYVFRNMKQIGMLICASGMLVLGFAMQYTEFNAYLFNDFRFELKYTLGRLAEMLPYAGLGIIIAHLNPKGGDISDLLRVKHPRILLGILGVLLILSSFFLVAPVAGFSYSGLSLMIRAIGIYCFFISLDLSCLSEKVKNVIIKLSKYSMGIYCIHMLVGKTCLIFFGYGSNTFSFAVLVYVISLILCALISLLPWRTAKQIVT